MDNFSRSNVRDFVPEKHRRRNRGIPATLTCLGPDLMLSGYGVLGFRVSKCRCGGYDLKSKIFNIGSLQALQHRKEQESNRQLVSAGWFS